VSQVSLAAHGTAGGSAVPARALNLGCLCSVAQVLAATQTPTDKEWFQGTADAVRQYAWLFSDIKNRAVEDIIILSGDHL
jgi:ADP-glucose pyrophosphorylase